MAKKKAKAKPFLTDVKTLRDRARKHIATGGLTFTYKGDVKKSSEILQAVLAAEIVCVYEKDGKFLEFLDGLHLHPGTQVVIAKREYDETLTLRVAGRTVHLGKPATSRVWVRQVS